MAHAVSLSLDNITVRQFDGLYSLNDLHKASGGERKHQPNRFIRLDQTQALIAELGACPEMGTPSANSQTPLRTVNDGENNGTYACRELVIAYAAWISAAFHLKVIRVFLAQTKPLPNVDQALAGANLIAARVQEAVFKQIMKSGEWAHDRWLLSFDFSRDGSQPCVRKIGPHDMAARETLNVTLNRLADQLQMPNSYPVELFIPLWMAINNKLAGKTQGNRQRMEVLE